MQPSLADRYVALHLRRHWRGLSAALKLKQLLTGTTQVRFRTPYGSVFDLEPRNFIDAIVLRHGFYESEVLEALRPYFLERGSVYWDVGANFGLHAVTAKRMAPCCSVLAFEPEPALSARLLAHARTNGVDVRILEVALTDQDGRGPLFVHKTNPGASTLRPWSGTSYDHQVGVTLRSAASLIASGEVPMPTVIKLDVEGSEEEALAGFDAHLASPTLRALVVEARSGWPGVSVPVLDMLRATGFQVRCLDRCEPTRHGLDNYVAERP